MLKRLPAINLLKKGERNFIDKFINWALTIGRGVIIVTEIVALSAFVYRFTLDKQIIDLHEQIKKKQDRLKLIKNQEDKFRNLQSRIKNASKIENKGNETVMLLNGAVNLAPSDIIFNTISVSENSIKINANLKSVNSLALFVKSLKEYTGITTVSLDKIENKTSESIITVDLTAILKRE